MLHWNNLTEENQIGEIIKKSAERAVYIFKHSTRCNISQMVLNRMNRMDSSFQIKEGDWFFLDLIQYRVISNRIEEVFQVKHESPQILVIYKGKCVFHRSHLDIQPGELIEHNLIKN